MFDSRDTKRQCYEQGKTDERASSSNKVLCWYCGGELIWQSDFNYDEIYGNGEGVVSFLTCKKCGADIQYSLRVD